MVTDKGHILLKTPELHLFRYDLVISLKLPNSEAGNEPMNIWRMKLRAGNYGEDMWPSCRERGIASMTHGPILNTDLSNLSPKEVPSAVKTAARSSIWRFAWEILGGDVIYVGDSKSKSIIARGYVTSTAGIRAYRYNNLNAMTEPSDPQTPWRHEVPVQWDSDFAPFRYIDGAPRYTVIPFNPSWVQTNGNQEFEPAEQLASHGQDAPLNELAYMRETPASEKNVLRLHAALSNRFRAWIEAEYLLSSIQEERQIDLQFSCRGVAHLVEFKICYGANTRHAIREALGQIIEYNYYPPYAETQSWWLVLDCEPSQNDLTYLNVLRNRFCMPLVLAWPLDSRFEVFPSSPLRCI